MSETALTIDPRALRNACGSFATGVTVISTTTPEGDHGMTANAFMSVSLDPPLLSISLDKNAKMLEKVRASRRYAINILSNEMEGVALHFAGRHNPDMAKVFSLCNGLPVLSGVAAFFLTDVVQEIEAGDHVILIGKVTHFEQDSAAKPLLFWGGKFSQMMPVL